MIEQNLGDTYAAAWSENQGNYSEDIADKTLKFIKLQGLKVDTVLDICCGSANFLLKMQANGKKCTGTEILDSYIEFNKANYPDMEFVKTNTILDFDELGKFDLITCNHDVINMLPSIYDWGNFFKKAYAHLNEGGILIFDYYTKRKLQNWNEVYYDESKTLEYIKHVVSDGTTSTKISNIYYINLNPKQEDENVAVQERSYSFNDHEAKFKKTEDTVIEYYFENNDILDQIKQAGYRYLIATDANFTPTNRLQDMNRAHIIAIKREQK